MKCDVCGGQASGSLGGVPLCRVHTEDVRAEIDSIRAQGKQVNASGIARRMYREMNDAGNYLLRDIPAEMMKEMKVYAAANGGSVRDVMLVAISQFMATKAREV